MPVMGCGVDLHCHCIVPYGVGLELEQVRRFWFLVFGFVVGFGIPLSSLIKTQILIKIFQFKNHFNSETSFTPMHALIILSMIYLEGIYMQQGLLSSTYLCGG